MSSELENKIRSSYKDEMMSFMASRPSAFHEAVGLALSDNGLYNWRAAWLLGNCMQNNDNRLKKYVQSFIDAISDKKDNHQREFIKILLKMELDDEQEGHLFNVSLNLWEDINKKPAVRYVAFKFISKLANKYPELNNEIEFYTQDRYMDTLSPGIRRSLLKMIKKSLILTN